MGYWTGRFGPLTAGSQTLTTGLSGTPIGCRFTVGGKNADTTCHGSVGTYDGTRQNVQYWSTASSGTNNTSVFLIKDATAATIFQGNATALGVSGGSGTVTVNCTTLDVGFQPTIEVWN